MTNIIALSEGTTLVGDYTIEKVLGAGGFGITYLAREKHLDRLVTIKEYFPSDFAARKDGADAVPRSQESIPDYKWGLERFVAEAQTLARFNHPHIVGVHRYFRGNNTAYMVLHYEEGQSLKNWLKSLGRVPRQADLDKITAPLLDALELIHNADFLHRDIAPDNVIIRKDGQPVLIDFGSARGEIARHSKTISALVKPGYSPYEQYAEKNSRQGPWTDIYALGATLFFAVTKKRPPDAVLRVTKDEYRSVSELALGSYRKRFLRAIDTALNVDIGSRPQSIAAWRGELLGPDEAKRSWISGRSKTPKKDPLDPLADPGPADVADRGNLFQPGSHPIPDAPGPLGGMLDFVDDLKKPGSAGPAGPAAHQARADAGETDLKTNPNEKANQHASAQAQAQSPAGSAAGTVKIAAPPIAPIFNRKRKQKAEPKPAPAAKPAPAPNRRAANKAAASQAQADAGGAILPVPVEPRHLPPKPPGEGLLQRGARWGKNLIRLLIVGAIGYGIYVNRDRLPPIDTAAIGAYIKELTKPAPRTAQSAGEQQSAKATPPSTDETRRSKTQRAAASNKRQPPAPPVPARVRTIEAHSGPITAMAYGTDGTTILTAGDDKTLRIWSADNGALQRIINMDHGPATSLSVANRYAATGHQDGHTTIWDLAAGTKIADLHRNEAPIWSVTFTKAGRVAVASHDWTVSLWDMRQPSAPIHVFDAYKNPVQTVALSNDGSLLASGGADKQLRIVNLDTLDVIRTYRKQRDFITATAFSPDDSVVASGTLNGSLSIFRTSSRSRIRLIRGHDAEISALAFSPDGQLLVSASKDGTLRVRETRRWNTIKTLPDHRGAVNAVSFSPDGKTFASSGADGNVRVWATAAFTD